MSAIQVEHDVAQDSGDAEPLDGTLHNAIRLANEESLPLELGRIELDDDGRVRQRRSEQSVTFTFTYRELHFAGELVGEGEGRLRLVGDLGKLPYTAESALGRLLLRRMVLASGNLPRGRITLTKDQDVRLIADEIPPTPRTPVSFMATVAAIVLEWKPYIDLLEEVLGSRRPKAEA